METADLRLLAPGSSCRAACRVHKWPRSVSGRQPGSDLPGASCSPANTRLRCSCLGAGSACSDTEKIVCMLALPANTFMLVANDKQEVSWRTSYGADGWLIHGGHAPYRSAQATTALQSSRRVSVTQKVWRQARNALVDLAYIQPGWQCWLILAPPQTKCRAHGSMLLRLRGHLRSEAA